MSGVRVGIDAFLVLQTSIMPNRRVRRNSRERPLHIGGDSRLDAPLSYACAHVVIPVTRPLEGNRGTYYEYREKTQGSERSWCEDLERA
jgi:hypothetical protein